MTWIVVGSSLVRFDVCVVDSGDGDRVRFRVWQVVMILGKFEDVSWRFDLKTWKGGDFFGNT